MRTIREIKDTVNCIEYNPTRESIIQIISVLAELCDHIGDMEPLLCENQTYPEITKGDPK